MTVVWINGPVGAGKTAVGRALADVLPSAGFVDGDDHAGPDDHPPRARWRHATDVLIGMALRRRHPATLVVAYPLDRFGHSRLKSACARARRSLVVVNLATPLTLTLRKRGDRELTAAERDRARVMRSEGYGTRPFATFSHPNARAPAARTAREIARRISRAATVDA